MRTRTMAALLISGFNHNNLNVNIKYLNAGLEFLKSYFPRVSTFVPKNHHRIGACVMCYVTKEI